MGAGKEAKTCTIGCARRIRDCDVPIQIPTGTVQIDPTTRHASTRMNVSPVPKRSSTHVTRGTWRSVLDEPWTAGEARDILEPELVCPCEDGPPNENIHNDDENAHSALAWKESCFHHYFWQSRTGMIIGFSSVTPKSPFLWMRPAVRYPITPFQTIAPAFPVCAGDDHR